MSSDDFERRDIFSEGSISETWTQNETLLLLEALETHKDDWDQVAEYVGTKTKEQCISHFIRMPIEDPYLESQFDHVVSGHGVSGSVPPLSLGNNPVMAIITFLATAVDADIGAAAADAALKVILQKTAPPRAAQPSSSQVGTLAQPSGESLPPSSSSSSSSSPTSASTSFPSSPASSPSSLEVASRVAAAVGLAAAASRAKKLADHEEKLMQKYLAMALEVQLKKLELKLNQFRAVDEALQSEARLIEQEREKIFLSHVAFHKARLSPSDVKVETLLDD
ncbi:MAG: Myb-like DNA-binding domain-containing protein [archaeon]|nr:Myb-like DNA-binding domain-containing protein [archaeon]